MPRIERPTSAAKASGVLICELATSRRLPSPSVDPTNSPITAPMTASVIATLSRRSRTAARQENGSCRTSASAWRAPRSARSRYSARRGAQPGRGIDHDGKERHQPGDREFRTRCRGRATPERAERARPWERLGRDQDRIEHRAQGARARHSDRDRNAEREREQETQQAFEAGDPPSCQQEAGWPGSHRVPAAGPATPRAARETTRRRNARRVPARDARDRQQIRLI